MRSTFFGKSALHLKEQLNLNQPNLKYEFKQFADGETFFKVNCDIQNQNIAIIQSTSTPANDNLIELLIMVDALKNIFPKRIKLIMPYFGYSRQDRFTTEGTSISAKVVANLIGNSGIDHLVVIDLHTPQQVGFFPVPVKHLSALPLFVDLIKTNFVSENAMIISPDIGGLKRAETLANMTDLPLAVLNKKRNEIGAIESIDIIGDVKGKDCFIVDDMIDSGGTLVKGARSLMKAGALSVHAFATHAVFSGDIKENLNDDSITSIYVTNTIHHPKMHDKVKVIPINKMILEELK